MEIERIGLHLTSSRVVIIVRGIQEGPMSREISLIWEIPAKTCKNSHRDPVIEFPRQQPVYPKFSVEITSIGSSDQVSADCVQLGDI